MADIVTGHPLGGFDCLGDGCDGFFDVDNLTFSDTPGYAGSRADDMQAGRGLFGSILGNESRHFGATDVNGRDNFSFGHYLISTLGLGW